MSINGHYGWWSGSSTSRCLAINADLTYVTADSCSVVAATCRKPAVRHGSWPTHASGHAQLAVTHTGLDDNPTRPCPRRMSPSHFRSRCSPRRAVTTHARAVSQWAQSTTSTASVLCRSSGCTQRLSTTSDDNGQLSDHWPDRPCGRRSAAPAWCTASRMLQCRWVEASFRGTAAQRRPVP